jgi:AcrR family transcriptional regulator
MQVKKNEIKEQIINAAKREFLELGFEKASLRQIAARAGVTKGNIYTYFKNKDELFCSIVEPAEALIRDYMNDDTYIPDYGNDPVSSEKLSSETYRRFVYGLSRYRDELKLLFFSSAGSGYTGFKEDVYRLYTESCRNFFNRWFALNPDKQIDVSDMLLHSFASLYLSFIEEILIHEPDDVEMESYISQMAKFVTGGMMKLINVN